MAASVFSSALYAKLFPTGEVGRLWTDSAEVRAMLLVEGALAKVQGAQGVIPEISAAFIHRSSLEVQIDPAGLADATGQNGVSVPALVSEFRKAMEAPEHAQYAHWGATSQDIIDTALMLRLRQTLAALEPVLRDILKNLGTQADAHADTPMVARTYGQHATPTSWGAVLAQWGNPLADALDDLVLLKDQTLWVSLSGAAGTASALGPHADETRAQLAEALKLRDPQRSWHTDRTPILHIADWMAWIVTTLAALGQSTVALASSDVAEITLAGAGSSSTMPQKQNPVGPSALVALGHQMAGLRTSLTSAASHQHQRDGAAWFTEWMVLPQIALTCAAALHIAQTLIANWQPNTAAMANKFHGLGGVHAEALSFALAAHMPRPDAQAATKSLIADALASGKTLETVARAAHPDLPADLFDPAAQLGTAPAQARAFAKRVAAL
ncbi:lyase family protein [Tateyamaria sp. syn59]|uniref:lyase family protein n=1 Tax=Tateyamaria sp. syn59 TaxID=2576942 RepID=UPI0011BDA5B0|nr:lyase family protein [Tateyamaria sp. syn59]